jgi:hypothetical protein
VTVRILMSAHPHTTARRVIRRARTLAALMGAAALLAAVGGAAPAAATVVTFCNFASWPNDGTRCPYGLPARHTYVDGRAASAAGGGTLYVEWYVAYLNSNAVTPKYGFHTAPGNILYSPISGNSEYLRGYAYVVYSGSSALYNEGTY